MDRDHGIQRSDLEHADDAGVGGDDRDAIRVSGGRGDRTDAGGVEEGAVAEVDDDVPALGRLRESSFEGLRAGHVELAADVHDGTIGEPLQLDREVDAIPHEGRV